MKYNSMKKSPVVLLHGLFGAPMGLEEIAKDLRAAGYEVIVPAVPPFAGTEDDWDKLPETDLSKRYAEYFWKYFKKNEIREPILIGHSMGTLVASAIMANYPELLQKKVVLLSPVAARPNWLISHVSALSAYLPQKFSDWVTTNYLATEHNPKKFKQILKKVHQCSLDQRPKSSNIKQAVVFSGRTTVGEELEKMKQGGDGSFEVALIAGENDHLISRKATEKLASKLNKRNDFAAQCYFLAQTGHLHNYEQPRETARKILEFLEDGD